MTDPRIRPGTADDWADIWAIFRDTVAAGETYAYPDLTSDEASRLWMERPPGLTVVLEEDGHILGTAKMGPNRPGRGDHIGTASFMVASHARGRGAGRQLGEWVVAWHRDQGFHGIQFNAVVETNTAAVTLWHSLGFSTIGTVPGAFRSREHGHVGLHVMYLSLAPEGPDDPAHVAERTERDDPPVVPAGGQAPRGRSVRSATKAADPKGS